MDKIGIPRGLFYYYYGDIWKYFLDFLKIPYVVSPNTNDEIRLLGQKYSNDEMCMAFKNYIGHVAYLKNKCDFIIVPRVDNFNIHNQTCTNFLAAYDIVDNLFDVKILNYNIDYENGDTLKKGLMKIGNDLGVSKKIVKRAYIHAITMYKKQRKREIVINVNKLKSDKIKILIVSHPYNTYDEMSGKNIIKYLEKNNIEIIYCDKFNSKITNKCSKQISEDLYFKYSKDNLGSIVYCKDNVDGVIFLSAFPCGPDSIANELAFRKIDIPAINIILDDNSSFEGFETRLESFIDMLEVRR